MIPALSQEHSKFMLSCPAEVNLASLSPQTQNECPEVRPRAPLISPLQSAYYNSRDCYCNNPMLDYSLLLPAHLPTSRSEKGPYIPLEHPPECLIVLIYG